MIPPAVVLSVHQQIAARLPTDVRCGLQAPGKLLREEQPAARSGVGRSLMGQVLQQLTHKTYKRLLPARPTSRTAVTAPPSVVSKAILQKCRARLTCRALPQSCDPLHGGDFQRWRDMPGTVHILETRHAACGRVNPATAGDAAGDLESLFFRVRGPFPAAAYRSWAAPGMPHQIAGIDDRPADTPRRHADHLCTQSVGLRDMAAGNC